MKKLLSLLLVAALLVTGCASMLSCAYLDAFDRVFSAFDDEDEIGGESGGKQEYSNEEYFVYERSDDGYFVCGLSSVGVSSEVKHLTMPDTYNGLPVIGIVPNAFENNEQIESVTVPSSVQTIGAAAFSGCSSLSELTLSEGLAEIGNDAFAACPSLTEISIPSSVETIGNSAFRDCTLLVIVIFLGGPERIGEGAFWGCTSLESVKIPSGTVSIGSSAFKGCSSLTEVSLPDTVTELGTGVFEDCVAIVIIVLPEYLTEIPAYLFSGCTALSTVVLPAELVEISTGAFYACTSLGSISFPEGLAAIGDDSFKGCSALTALVLPVALESVGTGAFEECTSLNMTYLLSGTRPSGFEMGISYSNSMTVVTTHRSHSFGNREDVQEATCLSHGFSVRVCTTCDYTEYTRIPATGHSFESGICTSCGAEEPVVLPDSSDDDDAWNESDPVGEESDGEDSPVETVKPSGDSSGTSRPSITLRPSVTTRPADPESTEAEPEVTDPITTDPETSEPEEETTEAEPETSETVLETTLEDIYGEAPEGYAWYEFYDVVFLYPEDWRISNISGGKQFQKSAESMAVAREPASLYDYYAMSDTEYEAFVNRVLASQNMTATVTSMTHSILNGYKVTRAELAVVYSGITIYEIQYIIEIGDYNYTLTFGALSMPTSLASQVYGDLIIN